MHVYLIECMPGRWVQSFRYEALYEISLGCNKVGMLPVHTDTNPWGRLSSHLQSPGWLPMLCVAWCLIYKHSKTGHTWHCMFLLKLRQHNTNFIWDYNNDERTLFMVSVGPLWKTLNWLLIAFKIYLLCFHVCSVVRIQSPDKFVPSSLAHQCDSGWSRHIWAL